MRTVAWAQTKVSLLAIGLCCGATLFSASLPVVSLHAEDEVVSGPQAGEPLPAFTVQGVFEDEAGKEMNFVEAAEEGPILLVFVHEMTRPSISFTRTLMNYAKTRKADGLYSGMVWLADDATAAEEQLKRARHALPDVPVGISPDGKEGPGSYGLNRQATLTILVGKEGKVTHNFALVQPSVPQDLPKVLEAVVAVAGGKVPPLDTLLAQDRPEMRREDGPQRPGAASAELLGLVRSMVRKEATDEEVQQSLQKIEALIAKDPVARAEMQRIARTIAQGGRLENFGNSAAQEQLKKWADEAAAADAPPADSKKGDAKAGAKKGDAKPSDAKSGQEGAAKKEAAGKKEAAAKETAEKQEAAKKNDSDEEAASKDNPDAKEKDAAQNDDGDRDSDASAPR